MSGLIVTVLVALIGRFWVIPEGKTVGVNLNQFLLFNQYRSTNRHRFNARYKSDVAIIPPSLSAKLHWVRTDRTTPCRRFCFLRIDDRRMGNLRETDQPRYPESICQFPKVLAVLLAIPRSRPIAARLGFQGSPARYQSRVLNFINQSTVTDLEGLRSLPTVPLIRSQRLENDTSLHLFDRLFCKMFQRKHLSTRCRRPRGFLVQLFFHQICFGPD